MYSRIQIIFIFNIFLCKYVNFGLTLDLCENHNNCEKCIMDPNNCSWCAQDNWNDFRCKSIYTGDWCHDHIINPISSIEKTEDKNFSSNLGKTIQINPQQYKIDLRIGQQINFNFSYEAAQDYPVDIYFLIDVSQSMTLIKKKTAQQSERIYTTINNLTSNVFLGLGTFIDKNVLPFKKVNIPTYSFKHHLKLTSFYETFQTVLTNVPLGTNEDSPEGFFDALAQVMVCKEEIGWRNQSRKIIVIITDAPYHAAGDALPGGIVKPYDGKCYTNNSVYSNEKIMDYPSVGIINKLARDDQFIVAFAVTSGIQYVYTKLSNSVRDSFVTTYDSTDMDIILKNIYEAITQTIRLDVRSAYSNKMEIKFQPDCLEEIEIECNVRKGQQTNFVGTIKLLDNIEADNFNVDILVRGIKEKLTLNIDIINTCNCDTAANSTNCNSFGTRRCGICECNPGRFGDKCECTATNTVNTGSGDNITCIAPGKTKICSGRGFCHCGSCNCRDRYNGPYCECDQSTCRKDASGAICNGHGNCVCGMCICTSVDWHGDGCECYKPKTPCIVDGKVCNNRGRCECGSCSCDPIAKWDARWFQDNFCRVSGLDYHNRQCNILMTCAKCHHSGNTDCPDCDPIIRINVTQTLNDDNITDPQWNICQFSTKGVCYSRYMYKYDDSNYTIEMVVQTDIDCAESFYMYGGIFFVTLVLIGILTLIGWKMLTDARDRKEYLDFLKQKDEDISATRCNPRYVAAKTSYHNPTYEGPN